MTTPNSARPSDRYTKFIGPISLIGFGLVVWFTQDRWLPHAQNLMEFVQNKKPVATAEEESGTAHAAPDTLTLSPIAWKNIGLITGIVEPKDFDKVVSVPAMVIERPGRSQSQITAPMTGVVTQIFPLERQSIEPGTRLFDLRLTHEDVVTAQTDFLTNLHLLDVANRELSRLKNIGEGIVPGKRIIEQTYELDRAQATLSAKRQSLLLHGMSEQQVADIERTRKVVKEITIVAPPFAVGDDHASDEHQYFVQSINVKRGQSVNAGELLSVLADHCLLYIEGKAFADDAERLEHAVHSGATIQVVPVSSESKSREILSLQVQSVANEVDQQSRALKFYLLLPNQLNLQPDNSRDSKTPAREFVSWKYRPGQRMEARIPTSVVMKNKIVLPPDAVVVDGPNAFVFEQNGDNFDRIDVQVLYRDKDHVVLENNGLLVGSSIAMTGAYQMHLAMKNSAGGAIDPHAGHNH